MKKRPCRHCNKVHVAWTTLDCPECQRASPFPFTTAEMLLQVLCIVLLAGAIIWLLMFGGLAWIGSLFGR